MQTASGPDRPRSSAGIRHPHLAKGGAETLLNVLGTLSAIQTKAKEWKYICEPVHIHSLALPSNAERASARFFSVDQVRTIIGEAAGPWKTFFTLAAMTGMRAGELLGLQIGDLDFERRVIQVRRPAWYGKAQSPETASSVRTVPMPESLAAIKSCRISVCHANNVVEHRLWPILMR
jgi:integrase